MKFILIAILSIFLQGCVFPKLPSGAVIPPTAVINIDSDALTQCTTLREDIVAVSFDDVLNAYGEISNAYGICAKKQAVSVKLIKQLGNIKDEKPTK